MNTTVTINPIWSVYPDIRTKIAIKDQNKMKLTKYTTIHIHFYFNPSVKIYIQDLGFQKPHINRIRKLITNKI